MENLSAGQVVLIKFPFSDLTSQKVRPCLIIGLAEFADVIVCQITSKPYSSKIAVSLNATDFKKGEIAIDSFIRPDKIATLDKNLIVKILGTLKTKKCQQIEKELFKIIGFH